MWAVCLQTPAVEICVHCGQHAAELLHIWSHLNDTALPNPLFQAKTAVQQCFVNTEYRLIIVMCIRVTVANTRQCMCALPVARWLLTHPVHPHA
jgi:hypothetical protein